MPFFNSSSGGLPSTGILPDSGGTSPSVDWYNRQLKKLNDSDAVVKTLDWSACSLHDVNETEIFNWAVYANVKSAGAASRPGIGLTGAIFTGGTGTTTFPLFLIQPTSATAATNWSTSGTAAGINAPTGFVGNFWDFKLAGVTACKISYQGVVSIGDSGAFNHTAGTYFKIDPYNGFCLASGNGAGGSILGLKFGSTVSAASSYDTVVYRAAAGCLEINSGTASAYRDLKVRNVFQYLPSSVTPNANGEMSFEATSNTSVTMKFKGSDGTVRTTTFTMS